MKYLGFIALFFYGLFYHVSSSEFWPITISKTWFTPSQFEVSMLQKPLLTMLLSLLHLLPLSDIVHLSLVKIIFTCTGIAGLVLYSWFAISISHFKLKDYERLDLAFGLALFLVLISPQLMHNYFNIRSDQTAFTLFSLFLVLCEKKHLRLALSALLLIPLFGIKEIIFLGPGAIYFFWNFRNGFSTKSIFFTAYSIVTVLTWVVALNVGSAVYLADTISSANYFLRFGSGGFLIELPLIAMSLLSVGYILYKKRQAFYKVSVIALFFMGLLLLLPQAYTFFIASALPFVFLPGMALLLSLNIKPVIKSTLAVGFVILSFLLMNINRVPTFNSNFEQIRFIKKMSAFLKQNQFNYLDGEGVFPRQTFLPCFVSPDDDNSNNSCFNRMKEMHPDTIIITNRLFFLGEEIFKIAQDNYEQIYPNVWVIKAKITQEISAQRNLDNKNPLPIIIF